jgi:hypothetical protein
VLELVMLNDLKVKAKEEAAKIKEKVIEGRYPC